MRSKRTLRTSAWLVLLFTILLVLLIVFPGGGYAAASSNRCELCDQTRPADGAPPSFPAMVLTPEQKAKLVEQRRTSPVASAETVIPRARELLAGGTPGSSLSLLPHIQYVPAERNQNPYCGNCVVWAATGILEVALDVQKQIKDRLSIQYFDSNYNNGAAGNFACCGIFENDFVSYYLSKMQVIPWSNVNAGFQDGSRYCFLGTARDSSQISETPNYRIASIGPAQQISTHTGIESVNIANIKSILDQNRAVEFDFYLTQGADWDAFTGWWSSQPESAVWSGSFSCGRPLYSIWNGHAVVCVGYDDSDANPSNHYWLMLNSWGTAPARPNDLLRIPMHYDYECADSSGGYNTFWYTIPVTYAGPSPTSPTVTNGSGATGITALTATLNGNLVSTGNSSAAIRIFWGPNDGGTAPERWANSVKLGILPSGAFASTVMGLMPDTLYHYRCAATNLVATSWAHTSASFRTPSTSPAGPPSSSASISSTPVLLPNVRVESASLSASKVTPGTPVTVTANIANGSNINGASLIRLYVNGQEEPGKSVAVAGGDRVLLTFTVSRDEPGTYSVFVAGAQAGSFIVDPFAGRDTILFISFGLIGLAFIIGIAYLASKLC